MFVDKYVSVFQVIGNVIRDGGYEQSDFIEDDLIQWAAEALDLIGVPGQYIDKVASLTGVKGKYRLPCDWKQRVQVAGLTPAGQFPMRESTGTFHPIFKSCKCTQDCNCSTNNSYANFETPISYDANGNPVINFSNAYNVAFNKNLYIGGTSNLFPVDPTYKINDNYIITNFDNKDCKILVAYKAFPVDDNGYPMIPDDVAYKMAVQWYIIEKLDYKMLRRSKIEKHVHDYSVQQCSWYMGKANEHGHQPSIDQLESWKNQTLQLLPKINRHSSFFERLGELSQMPLGNRLNNNTNYFL
jgi:hypothetical protein